MKKVALFCGFVLFASACTSTDADPLRQLVQADGGSPVPQIAMLKATGLYLTDNPLEAPPGGLQRADEAVVRRGNVLEPRRGNAPDVTLTSPALSLTTYRDTIIGNTVSATLFRRESSSSAVTYSGFYSPPTGSLRMRFAQAKNNLYFTSTAGMYRLDDVEGTPSTAGEPQGLEGTGALTGSSGFLPDVSAVAYRFVWGRRDANGNLILGAPSGRLVVTNTAGASRDVIVTERIPAGIVAGTDFLQIYRTETRLVAEGDPGEEMALIAEEFPIPADVTAGTYSYTDVTTTPSGPTAYFSPSQGGIINAKEQPPIASDMAMFKGHAFYAVKSARQQVQMTLLAVGGSFGLGADYGLRFVGEGWTEEYNATSSTEDPPTQQFQFYTSGTAAQNIENTARSIVRVINAQTTGHLYATYASSANDFPGIIIVRARDLSEAQFEVAAYGTYDVWSPAPRRLVHLDEASRTSNVATVTTIPDHNFVVGQVIALEDVVSSGDWLTDGLKTLTAVTANSISFAEPGPDEPVDAVNGRASTENATLFSDDGVRTNTWALSSFEEPEAVPPGNYFTVGGETSILYRVVAQGDGLWFFCSDGVYRLSGDTEDNFALRPFDLTVKITAPDTAVALENRVWALTDQGVVAISDVGVETMSHVPGRTSIRKPLQELEATFAEYALSAGLASYSFAMAYETEHEYRLWLPGDVDDTSATYAYVFNTQQGAWTKHNVPALHAVISPAENRQYISTPILHMSSYVLMRERKTLTASDYQDVVGVGIDFDVAYTVLTADNPGALKNWQQMQVHFETAAPATIGVNLATEVSTTPEGGTLTTDGLTYVRTYIPTEKSYGSTLTVGLTHSTAAEKCSVLGITVTYAAVSDAVR